MSPRVHVAPRAARTYGDLASDFASDYGLTPDDWQALILDDWLGEDAKGRWVSLTCGLSVPRQNGKNGTLEVRELFGMVGRGEKILHTAHQVKTAQKHFRRLKHFFGRKADDPTAKFPELNALVAEIRNVNGQEAIFLRNGGSVEIVARSQGSGRGFTVDVIVCDEAQDMSDDDQEALLSTSSASPLMNPQWIYTGTPPGPKANGEVFTRIRLEALSGKGRRHSWHEWSCSGTVDMDDPAEWHKANPALGTRLLFDVVEGERSNLSDDGFARERLGMWAGSLSKGVIPAPSWQDAEDASIAVDRFAIGVECGPDLSWASVSLAGQRMDGDWHIELSEDQHTKGSGVVWLVPYVEALVAANPQIRSVVVDVGGPISALLEQRHGRWFFIGSKVEITPMKVAELGQACSLVLNGIVTGWLHHIGQPQLSAAALSAGKRALGDTGLWVWSRRTATSDITPIQSCTYALCGAQTSKVNKPTRAAPRKVVVRT